MEPQTGTQRIKAVTLSVIMVIAGIAAIALLLAYFLLGHWIGGFLHYVYYHYEVIPLLILGLLVIGVVGAYVLVVVCSWFAFKLLYSD